MCECSRQCIHGIHKHNYSHNVLIRWRTFDIFDICVKCIRRLLSDVVAICCILLLTKRATYYLEGSFGTILLCDNF